MIAELKKYKIKTYLKSSATAAFIKRQTTIKTFGSTISNAALIKLNLKLNINLFFFKILIKRLIGVISLIGPKRLRRTNSIE